MRDVGPVHNQIRPVTVDFGNKVDISHIGNHLRKHNPAVGLLNPDVLDNRHFEGFSETSQAFPQPA
jgi:hypothetical protein